MDQENVDTTLPATIFSDIYVPSYSAKMIDCSIIIPHYNQPQFLAECLRLLQAQKTEKIIYEIIVVDNGSDHDLNELQSFKDVHFYKIDSPKNPYVCRNKGIAEAKGKILCYLDAKCRPEKNWLVNGYDFMNQSNYQIVAGHFDVESTSSLSSKIFPVMYLNNSKNVKHGYGVPSGNLFVKKELFEKVGLFDTLSASGSDIAWSKKALSFGYKIGYCRNSRVKYPGKSYPELLRDINKYGQGAYFSKEKKWHSAIPFLFPMKLRTFVENSVPFYSDWTIAQKIGAWLLVWRAKIQFALGILSGPFSGQNNAFQHS